MTGFFGRHNAKVDDKGRLVIPSAIKNVVPADQMMFVIRKDMHSDCLEMYTWQEWSNMSEAVRSKLDLAFNDEHMKYWRTYMSNTAHVTPDAKLGRISIPKELLEAAGITKDVVVLGVDYKVEIWAKEKMDGSTEVQPQLKEECFSLGGQFRVEMESFRHGKLVVRVPEG